MKIILSPAKSLEFETKAATSKYTQPIFLEQAQKLNGTLKKKSAKQISKLMSVSDALGQLNFQRNQEEYHPYIIQLQKSFHENQ